jgi:hypothetical protein
MSDDTEYERAEKLFGADMKQAEAIARVLNPELVMNDRHVSAAVIDLRKTYNITLTRLPTRCEQWEAIDLVTFDPDPESRWHIRGIGDSTCDAISDLLQQLAEEALK